MLFTVANLKQLTKVKTEENHVFNSQMSFYRHDCTFYISTSLDTDKFNTSMI